MNIVVRTYGGHTVVRPDTTWERDGDDLYVPEFIGSLSYAPVFTAHICKAGKCIAPRFADRYIDAIGFGVLLYPDELLDGSEEGFASASCLDHSSFIVPPALECGCTAPSLELFRDGVKIFSSGALDAALLRDALCTATRTCFVRRGDILAVEIGRREALCRREAGEYRISEHHCGQKASDYKIIF